MKPVIDELAADDDQLFMDARQSESETAIGTMGDGGQAASEESKDTNLNLLRLNDSLPIGESSSKFTQSASTSLTNDDEKCGFAKPATFLFFLSLLVIAQSCAVIGYSSSIQTSLQKQFGFTTNQYGVIVSSFEYTSIPSVVLISFFGHRRNRARLIGYGSLLIAIGCGVYVLPFVFSLRNNSNFYSAASSTRLLPTDTSKNWSASDISSQLCEPSAADTRWYLNDVSLSSNVSLSTSDETPSIALASVASTSGCESGSASAASVDASFSSAMFGLLVGAQMILGLGSSPIYTLGPTYLYDAVSKTRYAALISLVYSASALGPALGFLMGALCLTVYITPWRPPPTASQADFVGAWWIGLLVCSALSLAAGIPLIFFPKRLRLRKQAQTSHGQAKANGAMQHLSLDSACGSQSGDSRSTIVSSDSISRRSTVTIIGKNAEDWTGDSEQEYVDEPPAHAGFGNKRSWTQIGPGLKRLFASRIWVSVSLCLIAENSIVTGFVTYLAKYLQTVFYVATNYASVIAGVILIPAAVTGFLAGGMITQKVLLDTRRTTLYMLFVSISTLVLLIPLGFLNCGAPQLAGVTVGYPEQSAPGPLYDTLSSLAASLQLAAAGVGVGVGVSTDVKVSRPESNYSLYAPCSASCGCSTKQYAPICADIRGTRISFYSACFAGCSLATNYSYTAQAESTMLFYYNCSCVPSSFLHVNSSLLVNASDPNAALEMDAVILTDGSCDSMCALIVPFLGVMFAVIFLVSSAQNAALILTLQSAAPDDRSFALGVQNFMVRLVAFIPAPIYFGVLFDAWCILWSAPASTKARSNCTDGPDADSPVTARYCLLTDIVALPYVVVGCAVLLKLFSVAACTCCWLAARSQKSLELDGSSAQSTCTSACASVVSSASAPSCISDMPTVRYTANATVAYRSNSKRDSSSRTATCTSTSVSHNMKLMAPGPRSPRT